MAKAISDEELHIKKRARRRLVGAIALVLLIVVFLPMILDSEPKPLNQDILITIPPIPIPIPIPIPKPESVQQDPAFPVSPRPAPSPPRITGMPASPIQPDPPPPVEPNTALPNNEPARSEERSVPKTAPRHEIKPAPATHAAGEESFVVQLGAFSNAANAKALQKKLQDNKFKAYTELVRNATGDRTRVRVGPYASREAAEKARDRLKTMKLIIGEAAVVRRD